MKKDAPHNPLTLSLLYAGFKRVGPWWNFKNVISPFYRLYYVSDGEGQVYMHNRAYELKAGDLFLIPKFTFHSYACGSSMDHYYICFLDDSAEGLGIPAPEKLRAQARASSYDLGLVKRFLELNPGRALERMDPKQYGYDAHRLNCGPDGLLAADARLESEGILMQLLSRFLTEESLAAQGHGNSYERLVRVTHYINSHLEEKLSVPGLAARSCLSPDYFARIFKRVFGMAPCEYIQRKRIERAQFLLVTTQLSVGQVAGLVGIDNSAQFARLFKKIAQSSPREYRNRQLGIY